MTTDTTTAHDLLVLADPVPQPPTCDPEDVARVVRRARVAGVPTAARRLRPGASRRRRLVVGVGAVAVTTAVAATVTVVTLAPDGPTVTRPSVARSGPTTTVPVSTGVATTPPAVITDPVVLLRAAAATSSGSTAGPPRPDQFLYVHEDSGYQAWLSMDGTHDGLIVPVVDGDDVDRIPAPGCRDGVMQQPVVHRDGSTGTQATACTPDPAYRPDVPSDPAALQQYLVEQAGSSETNNVAKQVLSMLEFEYLPPATRGALFTVLSGYQGLSVVDIASHPDDVGVTWGYGGGSVTLVFTRQDHAFRGFRFDGDGGGVNGVTTTVVDAVGQTG